MFEEFWCLGLLALDALDGIDWSWLAMDGAMTKAPLAGEKTGPNPMDRDKGGVKRSFLTEAHGIPIAIAVDGANRHDMKTVCPTIEGLQLERPVPTQDKPQGLCLDKGYDYEQVRQWIKDFGFIAHIRARGEEAAELSKDAGFRARRWVVERTHSWMNRFRGLLIRWPKMARNYLACLHLVCGICMALSRPTGIGS